MEYGAYSHKGLHRKSNEDYYYIPNNERSGPNIIIVADGMGGHNAGELASRMTVEYISSYFLEHFSQIHTTDELINAMHQSIQDVNNRAFILSGTDENLSGMGTTLTMAVFWEDKVHVAHVGDSRCYLLSDNNVKQITRDHSLVQELLDNGSITHDEMDIHPKKNVITRALGTEDRLKIDCFEETVTDGDTILLCTDGLINYINVEVYGKDIPSDISVEKLVEILGNEALTAGGADDITVVAARYSSEREKR